MSEQKKSGQLDQLLDSLLSGYSDVEARPGMQTRLLANLHAESLPAEARRVWLWPWVLASASTVALVAALFATYRWQVSAIPQPPKIQVAGPPSSALPAIPAFHEPRMPLKNRRNPHPEGPVPVSVAEVRQEVFPARSPLSEQERLFFRYLAETPPEEIASHSHSDEPAESAVPFGPQSQKLNETEVQGTR